jgi:hypothetical protein
MPGMWMHGGQMGASTVLPASFPQMTVQVSVRGQNSEKAALQLGFRSGTIF